MQDAGAGPKDCGPARLHPQRRSQGHPNSPKLTPRRCLWDRPCRWCARFTRHMHLARLTVLATPSWGNQKTSIFKHDGTWWSPSTFMVLLNPLLEPQLLPFGQPAAPRLFWTKRLLRPGTRWACSWGCRPESSTALRSAFAFLRTSWFPRVAGLSRPRSVLGVGRLRASCSRRNARRPFVPS